jgi:hypothetical protein
LDDQAGLVAIRRVIEGDITNFLLGLTEEKSMAFDSVAKYVLFHKMWELRAEYVGALRQSPFFG